MRKNIYTETMDSIKVPEQSINKALRAVREKKIEQKENVIMISRKLKFTGMMAASLAVVVAIGGAFSLYGTPTKNDGKSGNSFVISAYAAEITKNNTAKANLSDKGAVSISEGDNDEIGYNTAFPLNCKGKNVKSVTYTVYKGAISVSCYKGENPIIEGTETHRCDNTPESGAYKEEDLKSIQEIAKTESKLSEKELEEKELENYKNDNDIESKIEFEFKHYSSVTLDYNHQNSEGATISLVGSNKELSKDEQKFLKDNKDDLFNLYNDASKLEAERNCLDKLIGGQIIHCTVNFTDGTQQSQDIKMGTEIGTYGDLSESIDDEKIEEMSDDMKNEKIVLITYSVVK
ncbi:MAG: hypothetical protein IJV39_03655 [Ruminococcus sp.]|nr:hypothetical protein [Ruminococcus sp.]